jgi:hypothetical protein
LPASRHPNATAVRALVRTLVADGKLDSRLRPVTALAATSAGLIDTAVANHERAYALANLLRAHNAILVTLAGLTAPEQAGEYDELLAALQDPRWLQGEATGAGGPWLPDQLPPWMKAEDDGG